MAKKAIYNVYDNGVRRGSFTPSDAEKVLGIPRHRVAAYADNKTKHEGRYSFEKEDSEENLSHSKKFTKEWDEARNKLLGKGVV